MSNRFDKYLIKDPVKSRVKCALARVFICSWLGHKKFKSFSGVYKPCVRCDA